MNEKLFGEPKIDIAKKALKKYLTTREGLNPDDQLAMVVYPWNNLTAYLLYPPFSAHIKPFTSRIDELKAKGPSPMGEGLKLAFDTANKFDSSIGRRIVLIYDGEYNQGIHPNEVAENILKSTIKLEKIYLGDVNKSMNNSVIKALDEKTRSKTTIVQTAGELYKELSLQRNTILT
jgi:Mg-chelatase subunit ChlD